MQQAGSDQEPVRTFEGYTNSIATFPDGKKIATAYNNTIQIWRLEDGAEIMKWVVKGSVKALAILQNGRHVISAEENYEGETIEDHSWSRWGEIWVRDAAESGRVVKGCLDGWSGDSGSLDVSPDGKTLASEGMDCRVILWDTTTWQKQATLPCYGASFSFLNDVSCVRFSPSGQLAIATNLYIQIWDLRRKECVAQIENYRTVRNQSPCNQSLTWTRDGARLLSTGTHLISAGAQLLSLGGGARLPSAARNVPKLFRSWDTSTWEEAGHSWTGHSQRIILNPAGTLLASASEFTDTIQLWHLLTGKEVARFKHSDKVFFVAFSVDGHFIFSAGGDKILQWKIPDEALTTASSNSPLAEGENNVGPSPGKQKNLNRLLESEIPGQRRDNPMNHQRIDRSHIPTTYSEFFSCNDAERPSSTRSHGFRTFFNLIRPSSDKKGKHKERQPRRHVPQVDVPLGQATYGDAVGVDDGMRPYVLFFCLSWFQKKKKKPDPPRPVYDDELEVDEPEEDILDVPISTTRIQVAQHKEIELKPMTSQSQPEAGPSCPAAPEEHPEAHSA